jgi:hypothetical protein
MALRVGDNAIYRSFSPKLAVDVAHDNLFVTWHETNANQTYYRLMTQKLSYTTGAPAWTSGGIQLDDNISASAVGYKSIQKAPSGQVAVFYMKMMAPYGNTQNYARLLNAQGADVWSAPLNFSTSQNYKAGLLSTPLIENTHWLTLWQDNRVTGGLDYHPLYLQRINIDGTLGTYTPPVIEEDTCSAPINPTVSNIAIHSVTISWTGNANGYRVEYKAAADAIYNSQETTSTSISLTGLSAETEYDCRVKSLCDADSSDWTTVNFLTLAENAIHDNIVPLFDISVINNQIQITNTNRQWIESVKVYGVNGALLSEKSVKNRENVTLSTNLKTAVVLVVVDGKGQTYTKKVVIQ